MLRGIALGIAVGAAATAVALKAAALRAAPAGATKAEAPAPSADSAASGVGALRAGNDALRATIENRKALLASLEAAEPATPKNAKRKAGEKSWKDLAPLLARAFAMSRRDAESTPELETVQMDFLALIARIGKQRGLTLDEAMSAPEALPQLLRALLEAGTPPGTPEQLARVDELIAAYAENWEKTRADETLTKLERRLRIGELADGYMQGVTELLTDGQRSASGGFEIAGMMTDGMGGGTHWSSGTREQVTANLADQWAKSLKLDAGQKALLGPYVEAYMKDYESANERVKADSKEDRAVWKRIQREQMRAQIRAQHAMETGLGLTPKQAKALRNWGTTYQFRVSEPAEER
ncbi:MAG: hypothetical protein IT452_22775 [Planctomycetia bacterium]|nr:hypothetical protein [Planctomycetia bacterium]